MAERQFTPQKEFNRSYTTEVITDPDSPLLKGFHSLLTTREVSGFSEGEVEPLEVLQAELRRNQDPDSEAKFICVVAKREERVVSGAYGSVQDGVLAIRFTLTEILDRGTGVSQEADYRMIEEAQRFCQMQGQELTAFVGECVEKSEGYWNRLEIEPGNGMDQIYSYEPTRNNPNEFEEIYYRLPPLEWNADGTPVSDEVVTEHLQVSVKGYPKEVPVARLKQIISAFWKEWYFRPRENFESDQAWDEHKFIVKNIMEDEIFAKLAECETVKLISKQERFASQAA